MKLAPKQIAGPFSPTGINMTHERTRRRPKPFFRVHASEFGNGCLDVKNKHLEKIE